MIMNRFRSRGVNDSGVGFLTEITISMMLVGFLYSAVTGFLLGFNAVLGLVVDSFDESGAILVSRELADSAGRAEKISRCSNPENAPTREECVQVDPETEHPRLFAAPSTLPGSLCLVVSPSEEGLSPNESYDPRHLECWHLSGTSLTVSVFGSVAGTGTNTAFVPVFDTAQPLITRAVDENVVSVAWECVTVTSEIGDCLPFMSWANAGVAVSSLSAEVCKQENPDEVERCYEKRVQVGGA